MPRALCLVAMLAIGGSLGCSREQPAGTVVWQLATRSPAEATFDPPVAVLNAGDSAVVSLRGDTIVVRRAEIVVREVALQPAQEGHCEPEEGEDCAVLEAGPVLVILPLHGHAEQMASARVKADAYSVLQVQIHQPRAGVSDAFVASHPEFANTSIRLRGTFSRAGARTDFSYSSDFNEFQELVLNPVLRVPVEETVRVTLWLNLARLFLNADEDALVDPASGNKGGPNEILMQDNVRLSLAAFRDENHDGLDDGTTRPATEEVGGRR